MLTRIAVVLVLLAGRTAWSQVEPGATGGTQAISTDNDAQLMMTPPPVSGQAYPTMALSETQANYLSGSVAINGGYVDNLLPGQTASPVNDSTFSILPTVEISRSTPRQQERFTYSPSFIFYQPTNVLDTVDQGAGLTFQDRLTRRATFSVEDTFYRSSNVFDQSYFFSTGAITGSTQTPISTVIYPFEEQLSNTTNAVISYQFARDSMVGGGASYSIVDVPASTNSAGIPNSNVSGASAFYNRRLSRRQYVGFSYQYSRTTIGLVNQQSETQTQSLLPFYTFYFARAVSFSISAGMQRIDVTLPQILPYQSWLPTAVVSVGWQRTRASLAANYTHTTTSGAGQFGAYKANDVDASGGWRVTRSWTIGLTAYHSSTSTVTGEYGTYTGAVVNDVPEPGVYQGGTTTAGQATLTRSLGEHFTAVFGYQRLHQEYPGIPIISANPDSDQEYGRITYQFRRPIRR